jgi:hypothetical protein
MPPIRSQNSQKRVEQEGRLLLAIQAIKNQELSSIRKAAEVFDVPRSTLTTRLNGITYRAETRANSHKLTTFEEQSLYEWIISLDDRGVAPRPDTVRDAANILLRTRGSDPPTTVGKNWVKKFVGRHPDLSTRFSRSYDYRRALCEDEGTIRTWFNFVNATIEKYGIADEDIYNFDETGFALGLTATAKVITRRAVLQPGNREWVTTIEAINATGWALPPCVIFKGKVFMAAWFNDTQLPSDWRFAISDNGWTNDAIGLEWLQKTFIPSTTSQKKGRYRLLVLDGHGSHVSAEFDAICSQNDIIPIFMPSHSSHLLQPLDIGCFAVLKRAYSDLVVSQVKRGISRIDKCDFLTAYP